MPSFGRALASVRARHFSALAKAKPAPPPAPEALNVLEATAAFVPQALADQPAQLTLWNAVLGAAISDIRATQSRPARLVVSGTDTAGARDLVTALLQEPFTSDVQQAQNLRERWATAPPEQTSLTIEYGDATTDGALRLPLAYLDQFPVPLQVIEAADPAVLHAADVAVLVSRLDQLHALSITRPDSIVVLNIDDAEASQPHASTSRSTATPSKYLFVSPSQALAALAALRESPGSPEAVQRYQTAFLASRVPALAQALHTILASVENISSLQNRTALVQIRSALGACRAAIQDARAELDRLGTGVSDLDAVVEEERAKVYREVFGAPDNHAVDRAVLAATDLLDYKLGHMKWRRMLFSIDEITTYVTTTVNRVWCIGLEKELTFHAGRLERMQRAFTDRAFALLAPSNTRGLHSPVLHNTLRQLRAAPAFPVVPTTLVGPLSARATQILEGPTARLHVAGQRALTGMGGATVVGAGLSWASWIGVIANAEGVVLLEPGTAMATGVLIALLGVRWAAWRWDRARKRWWEDFERVAGGLKQDLAVRPWLCSRTFTR
ncbi:hypothetical protein B0H17DRAFT_915982 [Mycena rosella]|uniref:Uncharacterized protein n=1 Tax=Mycena rosella TaxID=1033263 RepID=A0AAD7H1M7_MYCRO|nr:hypothetical protein B0H17DRAFT_915982 [Mycena rosella]